MTRAQAQGGSLTQDDIDAALEAATASDETTAKDDASSPPPENTDITGPGPITDPADADYMGSLSKEDIETLLHGDLDGPDARETRIEGEASPQSSPTNTPSPDASLRDDNEGDPQEPVETPMREADADLVAGDETENEVEAEALEAASEIETVSQEDIDRLLLGALEDGEDEMDDLDGSDFPEAALDGNGDMLSGEDLGGVSSDVPAGDGGAVAVETDLEPAIHVDAEPVAVEASPVSIEGADDDAPPDPGEGTVEGDADTASDALQSTTEHITQDDINRLLKESVEEADLAPAGEEDAADAEASETSAPPAATEGATESAPPAPEPEVAEETRKPIWKDWLKKPSRISLPVLAVSAGCAVLLLTIAIFAVSHRPTETASPPRVLTISLEQTGEETPAASTLSDTRIEFSDFIVFAPPNSAGITYVTADVILEVSDPPTRVAIKENGAFVRDVIYGTIRNELMARDIAAIDEISLEMAIRKALGEVIERGAIDRIAFGRLLFV